MVSREEFEELRAKLALNEEQQRDQTATMMANVEQQVASVAGGLQDLYDKANASITALEARIRRLEAVIGGGGGHGKKSLDNPKHSLPDKLAKAEDWRHWMSDVEDYCEEVSQDEGHHGEGQEGRRNDRRGVVRVGRRPVVGEGGDVLALPEEHT